MAYKTGYKSGGFSTPNLVQTFQNAGNLGFNSVSDLRSYEPIRRTNLINEVKGERNAPAMAYDAGDETSSAVRPINCVPGGSWERLPDQRGRARE